MSWQVIVSPRAEKDLEELDNPVSERVKQKLIDIEEKANQGINPEHYLKWINKYEIHRLRVGDYRVFIDLDNEEKRIEVITVMKRDNAYRGWG